MRVLDLFSGIGGFSLGLERAGFTTAAFCEIDPYCQAVLKKYWPNVPIYTDIRKLEHGSIDIVCGGFPCQDISIGNTSNPTGISGERSGLWREMVRTIRMVRPIYAIVENVAELLSRGMGTVLGDLAEVGHDAEWDCIPACSIGAPHIRDRIWILTNARRKSRDVSQRRRWASHGCKYPFLETDRWREAKRGKNWELSPMVPGVHPRVASSWWRHQSSVARTADGLHGQLDRNAALGNAVIPQIPEIIGGAIMEAES